MKLCHHQRAALSCRLGHFGDVFLATTNYLWGVHGDFGHFQVVGNVSDETRKHTSAEIARNGEIPRSIFMLTMGSFFDQWFHEDDDVLRVCLGMPDTALTVSWVDTLNHQVRWRSDRMHIGAPVYAALQDTFAAHADASSRATFLLGDPFLREHYVPPVTSLTATKSGGNVNLTWTAQAAATEGYRVFRANSTNTASWSFLTDLVASATNWVHSPSSPSTNAYLIKSLALKITGSGSYTNLSLGTVSTTEVTLP